MTINTKELVLLVVDMQNGFLGHRSGHVLPIVTRVVEEFKKRGIPVVLTRFHNNPDSQYERLIGWTRLRTSPEVDLAPGLEFDGVAIIDKTIYTALTPEFISMIESHGWRTVAICGVATDGCVLKTAVDVFERGMVPLVLADACASHAGDDVHKAGLLLLSRFIGKQQVISSEELLAEIDKTSIG